MAIVKMKRFSAVTLKKDADSLISSLQLLRCVDLTRPKSLDPESEGMSPEKRDSEMTETKKKLAEASASEEFLAQFLTKGKAPFSQPNEIILSHISGEVLTKCKEANDNTQRIIKELSEKKSALATVKNETAALEPWRDATVELPSSETKNTKSISGAIPSEINPSYPEKQLEDAAAVIEVFAQTDRETYLRLTAHKSDFERAYSTLSELGFIPCPCVVSKKDGYAEGRIKALTDESERLTSDVEKLTAEAVELSKSIDDIKLYCDLLSTELAKLEASERLYSSEKTVLIAGWVPEQSISEVTALLEERGDAYSFEDANPEDDVPVKLSNNAFSSQFEPVIELYSMPAYGSFDPTSIMSAFFFIIFGMMLADVGYGFIMSLFCLLGLKLMKPSGSMKKMLSMFAWCGVSCMIMGVLFGGYFSDAPTSIMQNWFGIEKAPDLALWINPMTDPMAFLVVSIAVGALHLVTALCIKFYVLWASKKRLSAVCDAGSWIVLFVGAGVFLLSKEIGTVLVSVGILMLIFTQGRSQKNIFLKIFKGFASLYDIVGYISDLLSYSRILSLGLASMVIGSVFNILGTMPGFSPIGVIFFFVIFTVGHLMNLAINLLGSFVHTSRLQYIEFFGKFYEDGGRPFEPLTPRSKYVIFK